MRLKRKARILTNLKIDEVSAVDAGAGEGCHIKLLKRDRTVPDFYKIFGARKSSTFDGYPPGPRQKNLDVHTDPDGPINPGGAEPDDDDDADYTEHLANDADAGDDEDDDETTDNDGADPNGVPTKHLERLRDAMKGTDMRKVKSLDAVKICKAMVSDSDAYGTSEHELVEWIDRYAKAHDTTFVKLYEANNDTGLAIRKAIDIAKQAQFLSRTATLSKAEGMPGRASLEPRVTGGRAAGAVDNPKSALDELQSLVDAQRAANPALSESEAWLRVYEHPDNRELAQRERAENRPVATGIMKSVAMFHGTLGADGPSGCLHGRPAAGVYWKQKQLQSPTRTYVARAATTLL
jgi:hypothetical protein